jgi:hypothetical protein
MSLQDDLQAQRAKLSVLYEQQETIRDNIKGLKQIIATLEYAINKNEEEATTNSKEKK